MNTERFLADQRRYFDGAYKQFCMFGGPCVYFHEECIRAAARDFLSTRHLEMLYATLTAWGMHRMGDAETTKTKLTDWTTFSASILASADELQQFRTYRMTAMSVDEYAAAVTFAQADLRRPEYFSICCYGSRTLEGIVSSSSCSSIPPIDRQYTVRFFTQPPERWRDSKGRFQAVSLPVGRSAQFDVFSDLCTRIKRLADRLEPGVLEEQRRVHSVAAPKALDNAIVNYVTIVSGQPIANPVN